MDIGGGSPDLLSTDPIIFKGFGVQLFSHITSFVDNSLHQSRRALIPGGAALWEAFNSVPKFAGALLFWLTGATNSNIRNTLPDGHVSKPASSKYVGQVKHITSCEHMPLGFSFSSRSQKKSVTHVSHGRASIFSIKNFFRKAKKLQSLPMLSLAASLMPPLEYLTPSVLAIAAEEADLKLHGSLYQGPCEVDDQGCDGFSRPDLNWERHAIEPRTGIEFPVILYRFLAENNKSTVSPEVLVGTGSRTMTIIKIKSLKVYAFGFYIHPYSVCEKLGPKYASIPIAELKERPDFYEDLLREDIGMTVRLVVNCNGMKINSVKNAFEKSLRARLVKTNPETDYECLTTFGSCFTRDIPLPAGTTIDFSRTADGQLITEIGGNQIGAVHSRDLCRAFFDMYIGEVPVSEQTKQEIGRNVASLIRRC